MKSIVILPVSHFQVQTLSLLLIFLCLSACEIAEEAMQFSADTNHQTYKIPQFPQKSPNQTDLGVNLMIHFARPLNLGSRNFFINDPDPSSTSASLYFQDQPLHNWSPSYTKGLLNSPLSMVQSTGFTDHLFCLGAAGFVGKRSSDGDNKINLMYFEVPLHLVYQYQLTKGAVYGGLGPYFAYGLGGKIKSTTNSSDKINSFDEDSGFKRFDAGFGIMAGYQFDNSLSLYLAYDWGLVNISRDTYNGYNRSFSLNVMYPLSKLKSLF